MKKLMKLVKNEDGAVLVLTALLMVALMGVAALVVDVGNLYFTKTKLQNAADAAALAGAQDIGTANDPAITAIDYAGNNGMEATKNEAEKSGNTVTATKSADTVKVTTPYLDPSTNKDDPTKIKVECTRKVSFTFARVLGFTQTDVSAHAVAKYTPIIPAIPGTPAVPGTPAIPAQQWNGSALPILNVSQYEIDSDITVWDKVGNGFFERISTDNFTGPFGESPNSNYFINFTDGITLADGNEGNKTKLKEFVDSNLVVGGTVYVISLSDDVITQNDVLVKDSKGNTIHRCLSEPSQYDVLSNQKDTVYRSELVLLKCTVKENDSNNGLILTVNGEYDIANDDFPTVVPGTPGTPDTPGTPGTPEVPASVKLIE